MSSRERIKRYTTTDGMGLLILGILAALRGWAYTPITTNHELKASHLMETWLPLEAWSGVWFAVAAVCFAGAVHWRSKFAAAAVGIVSGLHFLFGLSFLWGTISGELPRGWVSGISYLSIAIIALWAFGRGRREDGYHHQKGDGRDDSE